MDPKETVRLFRPFFRTLLLFILLSVGVTGPVNSIFLKLKPGSDPEMVASAAASLVILLPLCLVCFRGYLRRLRRDGLLQVADSRFTNVPGVVALLILLVNFCGFIFINFFLKAGGVDLPDERFLGANMVGIITTLVMTSLGFIVAGHRVLAIMETAEEPGGETVKEFRRKLQRRNLVVSSLLAVLVPLLVVLLTLYIYNLNHPRTTVPAGTVLIVAVLFGVPALLFAVLYGLSLLRLDGGDSPAPEAGRVAGALSPLLVRQYNLTRREEEIILMVVQGGSNGLIARTLFVSVPTVKTHLYHIFRKMEIDNRTQLVRLVLESGKQP